MFDSALLEILAVTVPPGQIDAVMAAFGPEGTTAQRVDAIREVLRAGGQEWRNSVGEWIADLLQVETLTPDIYENWRVLVHESMAFVASHISDGRLAPKIVEQIELPPDTPVEARLLKLIAKTPGLQKLGQVLARTRNLSPALRRELQTLENGISDMTPAKVRALVTRELGTSLDAYRVEMEDRLLSEASVSAILEFTWLNPVTGLREEGVFKVLKPHVPLCYAEDLSLLQQLAEHLSGGDSRFGFASKQVSETLDEVRMLLQNEVDFRREQVTLAEIRRLYNRSGFHAPKPIPELCTATITAMSKERGVKVTDAYRDSPFLRRRVATQIVEALIADPIFSPGDEAIFHADPHAGNLLYDERNGELIALDWALTGRLSLLERRRVARLIGFMTVRDWQGVCASILSLSRPAEPGEPDSAEIVNRCVRRFFARLPHVCSLGAIEAMRLLDEIGMEGVRFPSSLVLLRKVLFTLDGVLNDVGDGGVRIDIVMAREFASRLWKGFGAAPPPFTLGDYLSMQTSALLYAAGCWSTPDQVCGADPQSAAGSQPGIGVS